MSDPQRQARAMARAAWPGRRSDATTAGAAGEVLTDGTPAERIAMVWALTLDAWAMRGEPLPAYTRAAMPGRIIRRRRL